MEQEKMQLQKFFGEKEIFTDLEKLTTFTIEMSPPVYFHQLRSN